MPTHAASNACASVSLPKRMAKARRGADRLRRFALLALLGGVAGLGQAPFDWWPATIISAAAYFLYHRHAQSVAQAAFQAWCFGVGYFAFSLRWIVEPFLVDVARHGWMAPFAIVLMATGAAAFWALAGGLAQRLAPRSMLMLSFLLTGVEMLRSLILTGFPWALLGHVWITTWLAQASAWGGPHLLTLATVLAVWGCAAIFARRWLTGSVVLVVIAGLALLLRPPAPLPIAEDAPIVRLVQPNAPQDQKWDPRYRTMFVERMLRSTAAGDVPDLVVWPETSIPFLLSQIEDDMSFLANAARGAPVVFGIQRRDPQFRVFNSLIVMGPEGTVTTVYDKQHLVPFGEYIPGARLLGQIGAQGLAGNLGTGFTPGDVPGPIDVPGIGSAVPLICYEGIFAEEITYGADRPRLLLLITNDAWFGQAAGPYQHLAQARLRAIEHGLPMVRVANTGISAMIDARGRITTSLALNKEGTVDAALPPVGDATLYSRFGDVPAIVALLVLTLLHSWMQRRDSD